MFNRTPKIDDIDLNQDVSQLADTLDDLLKSYASKTEDEMATARSKAESLLKETRARLNGNGRVSQAARDAAHTTDAWVHDKPWHSVGIGAAVGIFIGALLASRR
ncbi:hypothetical protein CIG19_15380 [Enterobacterales bacterium CwR94]|nr:hypothetical protein CIG19_15380 [Enterobacterales bacterium CwR94]